MLAGSPSLFRLSDGLFQPDFKSLRVEFDIGLQQRKKSVAGESASMDGKLLQEQILQRFYDDGLSILYFCGVLHDADESIDERVHL